MAELRPFPFAGLVRRLLHDLKSGGDVFDLPRRKFFLSPGDKDLSVQMHGLRASSALGPAAGPQTQMAQNLVLSYLSGCRIMELKTVQVNDRLEIPRPCIDMQTIGYNVEWSQELRLQESLEEYVKGAMLIEILLASGLVDVDEGYRDVIYDMSAGYDLAGIQSDTVLAFLRGMTDCTKIVDRFRKEIPEEFKEYRDLNFKTRLSDTLTLSTFHGCPPDEIEKIMVFLLKERGLHAIVKLNPTLLGPEQVRYLMANDLGYTDVRIPDSAFENDTQWGQAVDFVERLGTLAAAEGRGFGVKFSNTLLVENHRDFFPETEKHMYLSGPPLHILAMNLVGKFRKHFGDQHPISFSAGIDRNNFADAVAIGLTPVTVCSDLLKPGGYARASGYLDVLCQRMDKVGVSNVNDYIIKAYGLGEVALKSIEAPEPLKDACREALRSNGDLRGVAGTHYEKWTTAAKLLNTEQYVQTCTSDARYAQAQNQKLPKKVGSHLELLDCVSCNKCIPVCPNDANFSFAIPVQKEAIIVMREKEGTWTPQEVGALEVNKKVQYGNFADFCNECGNCDIFCPEDGGPYVVKGRFFGSLEDWTEMKKLDGFFLNLSEGRTHGRFAGKEFTVETRDGRVQYSGEGFEVSFDASSPLENFSGKAEGEVDLSFYFIMNWVREAVLDEKSNNYLRFLG
jgi:putative selenate reductase